MLRFPQSILKLSCIGAATAATACYGQFSFSPAVHHFAGQQPDGVAAADLSGDGIPDLAVTADQTLNSDDVAILLGNADGTFELPFYVPLPNSSSPGSIVAGDLDGDTDVDLAVTLRDFNQVIAVINQGSASFTLGATAAVGANARGMDIADAEGDGDLDLVIANRDGNSFTYLQNGGSASFTSLTTPTGLEPRDAAFGDFDSDGDLDVAVACHDDRTVRIHRNDGGAMPMVATLSVGNNDRPEGIETGDLNGNGVVDIAAASGDDEELNQNRAVLFLTNSITSFTGPQYVFAGPGAIDTSDIALADLDCDGDLDIATGNQTSNNVSMMLNNGSAVFGAATIFTAGLSPDAIIAADLQGDGDDDVVTANRNSNDVSVFLSGCGTGGNPICGNGICEAGEDNASCPGDCPPSGPVCGNGICELGESESTCPQDCGGGGPGGEFAFASASIFVGDQPDASAAGDFDGDGIRDLATTADAGSNDLAILFGNGDGTFAAPVYVDLPSSTSPGDVVAGNLDSDTDIDLAVGLKDAAQVIAVINQGGGTFALGATAATGAEPRGIDIADADIDGDLDLVVANRTGNSTTFLLNNGDATFASSTLPAGVEPRDAVWANLDSDSELEAAVSNHDDRTIGLYQNAGGSFAAAGTVSVGAQDRPDGLDAGDVNDDSMADLVTASGDDTLAFNRIVMLVRTGDMTFAGPAFYPTGGLNTSSVVLADLDCDGDLDAAAASETSNDVSVMANNGSGVFGAADLFTVGANPGHIIAADLDSQNGDDLVTSNRNSDDITVMLNESCQEFAPADFDQDGEVGPADLGSLLAAWGKCPGCPQDLDGDGQVGPADLAQLLATWGK
jgi:hypothetical protein